MKVLAVVFGLLWAVWAHTASLPPTSAKIEGLRASGFSLRVGNATVVADWTDKTRAWANKVAVERSAFRVGDTVWVRLKEGVGGDEIREIADVSSWNWLESIRKTVKAGSISAIDAKYITVKFADSTTMAYRATPKSKVSLSGQPATLADLKVGQALFWKGRTLATLDTWLVYVTDKTPSKAEMEIPSANGTKSGRTKTSTGKSGGGKLGPSNQSPVGAAPKLQMIGEITGRVQLIMTGQNLFDMFVGSTLLHINYTSATRFLINGQRVAPGEVLPGMSAKVSYRRDTYGRIYASRVILFGGSPS